MATGSIPEVDRPMIALGKIEFGFVLVVDADVEIGIVKTLGLIIPTSCRSSCSRPFMRSSFTLCLKTVSRKHGNSG